MARRSPGGAARERPDGPVRSCVVCRRRDAKKRLLRVVADPAGRIRIDDLRREPGRGAYLHPTRSCLEGLARKRDALGRALRRSVVLHPSLLQALEQRIAMAGAVDRVEDRKGNEEE